MAANVALVPHPDGYWCWSTKNRRWIQPDLGMALLMLAFVSPTPASEVFSSRARLGSVESLGRGIACLLDAGLLIRSDDKPMERPDSARKRPVVCPSA